MQNEKYGCQRAMRTRCACSSIIEVAVTRAEEILLVGLEDAESVLGLVAGVIGGETGDIVRRYRDRANATLQLARALMAADREAAGTLKTPPPDGEGTST